jgi:hypothetical protein
MPTSGRASLALLFVHAPGRLLVLAVLWFVICRGAILLADAVFGEETDLSW